MGRLRTRLREQPRRQTPLQFAVHGVGVSRRPGPVERERLCRARCLRLRGVARENMGMQRRRVHGIIAEENFNPRAIMDDDVVKFDKSMESIGTVADPLSRSRGVMRPAEW